MQLLEGRGVWQEGSRGAAGSFAAARDYPKPQANLQADLSGFVDMLLGTDGPFRMDWKAMRARSQRPIVASTFFRYAQTP